MSPSTSVSETQPVNCSEGVETIVIDKEEPSRKSKLKWSKEATLLLISGWLNTSKDAIVGNDQSTSKFWERIAIYFNTHNEGEERVTGKQCKDHWNMLNQRVARFNGCYKRVQEAHHSGWSEETILENAHAMYKSENNTNFQLMHCWRVLKDEPKWNTMYEPQGNKRTKVSESGAYTSESNADISHEEVRVVRPTGQKAAKRKAKGKAKNDSSASTFMDINERKASALEKLVAIREKEAEDNRMTKYMDYLVMDTSYMTPEQKKDHESLCAHIRTNILKF